MIDFTSISGLHPAEMLGSQLVGEGVEITLETLGLLLIGRSELPSLQCMTWTILPFGRRSDKVIGHFGRRRPRRAVAGNILDCFALVP